MHRGIWTRILRKFLAPTLRAGAAKRPLRRGKGKGPARLARPAVRPQLEGLEERTLFSANTYVVNVLGDNGGAAGTQSGQLSGNLRWCIDQANLPANSGSTITFDQNVFLQGQITTLALTNGELAVSNSMTIVNAGGAGTITVSGDADGANPAPTTSVTTGETASRVFDIIPATVTVTIQGLTISGGNANPVYTPLAGNQGGDIFNGGNLTLTNDVVENGYSSGTIGSPPGRGGGIFNAEGKNGSTGATLTLTNTIVEDNVAKGWIVFNNGKVYNQGIGGAGGGIYNDVNATVNVQSGSEILSNLATGNSAQDIYADAQAFSAAGGPGLGGGIFNAGTLNMTGSAGGSQVLFEDNTALGGAGGHIYWTRGFDGGNAAGGAVFNSGSMSLQYVQFLGNQALGGIGGSNSAVASNSPYEAALASGYLTPVDPPDVGDGGFAGTGGNAQGGAIYNAGAGTLTLPNLTFGVDKAGTANQAIAGAGGDGGNGMGLTDIIQTSPTLIIAGSHGGAGGDGGIARGGAVASTSGGLVFQSTTITSSAAKGGAGGGGGGGYPGFLPSNGSGDWGGYGGVGGNGGDAFGGSVFNFGGSGLSFSGQSITKSVAAGGLGGAAGAGAGGASGPSNSFQGRGGQGGAGGVGGGAQGGGFYNANAVLTINGTSFSNDQALSGSGGAGGPGGGGGQGGTGADGGRGGAGGNGGDSGRASGGAGEDIYGAATVDGTFSSNLVQSGNAGNGGSGGNGGDSHAPTAIGPYGGGGGDGGAGGNGGPALGGDLAVTSSNLTLQNSTFSNTTVTGGSGGNGGKGGKIGSWAASGNIYVIAYDSTHPEGTLNPAGNGGNGGTGATVSGGAVSVTNGPTSDVDVLSAFQGLKFNHSQYQQANPTGAFGASNYVETTNQAVAIFSPKTPGIPVAVDTLADFFTNVGKLSRADSLSKFLDPAVVWDAQIQRFIIVDQDVDGFYNNGSSTQNKSFLDIAVSTLANPATLTAADWNFFQISTTETQNGAIYDPQFAGNIGFNHDALVVTLNMYNQAGVENHVQVNTISLSALTSNTALSEGSNAFQFDFTGANLRPAVMQDSKAGDPVWFVQTATNSTISVVDLTNPLSSAGAFTTNSLAVKPYSPAVSMVQPDGTQIGGVSSDIGNVSEDGGFLVAAQTVSDAAGNEDSIQWYEISISSGTAVLEQQGDVGGGAGLYDAFPSIAINASGDIGLTYAQSGSARGQFLSTYVTGQAPTDPPDTMQPPVLVQPGASNYTGSLAGPLSAITVDSNGNFWAVNEYADQESSYNWSTEIAEFSIPVPPTQTVSIGQNTTFTNSSITAGNGGNGAQAGLGSDDGKNHGINGQGGNGGNALGGTLYLTAQTAQSASIGSTTGPVTITSSNAKAGTAGAGAINNVAGLSVSVYYKPAFGQNGHFSNQNDRLAGLSGYASNGGTGGSVEGVGIFAQDYNLNLTSTSVTNGTGTAGAGGAGGSASVTAPNGWDGGTGGLGGAVQGGGVYLSNNLAGTLNFSWTGGAASNFALTAGTGGAGGNAGASTTGNRRSDVFGGDGGSGGDAQGGGIYIVAGTKSINNVTLDDVSVQGDQITGGSGGQGGAGYLANGGLGGFAQGGGVFNTSTNGTGNQTSSLSITASTLAGDDATGGNGGSAGSGTTPNGGAGGAGGNAGNADGGGLYNGQNTPLTIVNTTFGGGSANTSTPNANANILTSGLGGTGGNAGTPAGASKNNGGNGGNGGSVYGGDVYNASAGSVFLNDTLVWGEAYIYGLAGPGGAGAGAGGLPGNPGNIGTGVAGGYYAAAGSSNKIGNSIVDLNSSAAAYGLSLNSNFQGIDYNNSGGYAPPNTQGAAGETSYVETVNQAIAIFNKSTGKQLVADTLADFWNVQGQLARASTTSNFTNPVVVWDEQIQRFIIGEQDVDATTHISTFDIAVSKSASPASLTSADWYFLQVKTTESGFDAKATGNLGWNHDALVFTLNMVNSSGVVDHVQINSISISALASGTVLNEGSQQNQAGANAFQTDFAAAYLQATVMHDSAAGAPMWFVEQGGDNKSINVVEMANVLSIAPAFTTTNLTVNPYLKAAALKQPDGSTIGANVNSNFQKAAEQSGLLVTAQTVSDSAGDEDSIQWYVINVSSGTPVLQQQGDVGGRSGVYDAFPSIDINPEGAIGMTFVQSGTGAGQYLSTYVTGRLPNDVKGTMETPILVQAGKQTYQDSLGNQVGGISAISVDGDGSFWAANEFANLDAKANWGTAIAHFTLSTGVDVAGSFTSLGNNVMGNVGSATGFITSGSNADLINVPAASNDPTQPALNIGPLLNNGGNTETDALLPGSAAITEGNTSLITNPPFSPNPNDNNQIDDQRGTGFARTFNNTVSDGAFEYLPPVITSLSPSSVIEGSASFTLTINGSNFSSGATVSFGSKVLTPLAGITPSKLKVVIPASLLTTPGTIQVTVNVPDGSGIAGQTESSAVANFDILPTPFTLNNPGSQQGWDNEQVKLQITTAAGFTASSFSDLDSNGNHTLPPGLSIDNTGLISGTIAGSADANSPYTVTLSAIDTNGDSSPPITFSWTVKGPLVLLNPGNQTSDEGSKINLQISAPAGYTPSGFTLTGQLPTGLSLNTKTGLISGTIDPRSAGSYLVTVTPTNNNNQGGVTFSWTVNDTTAPVLVNPGTQTSAAGQNIVMTIQAADADSGTWTATGLPPGLSIDANGVVFGTIATSAQGSYAVTIQAADGKVQSAPISFLWYVSGSVSPSSPASPPSSPPGSPPGSPPSGSNAATSTTIVNVTNQYPGFVQLETVTVDVTSSTGAVVNEGIVAIQVDGQTAFVPVQNGVATATFATSLLDFNLWTDLLFTHPLTVSYSDTSGAFATSATSATVPGIWIDYFLTLLALDAGQLNQFQG